MSWMLTLVLLCPCVLAETLTVHCETGAWRFSFRVPAEATVGAKPALAHSDFLAWHQGHLASTVGHKLEFTRGPWGYTLSIQPNDSSARITLFNHTSLGDLWFATAPDVLRLRPGWYRFGAGHSVSLQDSPAMLRIEGELDATSGRKASSWALLLAGLLAGAWITCTIGLSHNGPQAFAEPCVGPGDTD